MQEESDAALQSRWPDCKGVYSFATTSIITVDPYLQIGLQYIHT